MEELKKHQILHVAMDIFKEKGYSSTSMQDIAETCRMAKGSIYKFFSSKEDLFTEAFEACHQIMFEQAHELDRVERQKGLSVKEKLQSIIAFELQYILENYFFMIEFKELPITDNEKFKSAWKKKRATLLNWHRDLLLEAYGDSITIYIWDVVTIFRGLRSAYLTYAIQKVLPISMEELAVFLVGRMDAVVIDMTRTKPNPVLNETTIYINHLNQIDTLTQHETVRDFLQSFELKIHQLQVAENLRKELLEVIVFLQKELDLEAPNKTLVHVFTTYLEAIPELRPYVRQLNLMI